MLPSEARLAQLLSRDDHIFMVLQAEYADCMVYSQAGNGFTGNNPSNLIPIVTIKPAGHDGIGMLSIPVLDLELPLFA